MTDEFILHATVPYWNVDREQVLLLRGVFEFFQEAAIKHADVFDMGTRAMISRGESWVLNRMAAAIHRYPHYEEAVKLVTWSTGIRACKGFRDFRLYSGDELVASASSLWLYVNLRTKTLSRVPPDVAATFPSRPGDLFRPELDKLKLTPPAGTAASHAISVRYSDVDGNGHVNNTAYFDYLQTALARSGASPRPRQIEIQFLKEIPPTAETVSVALETRGQNIVFGLSGPEGLFAQGSAG